MIIVVSFPKLSGDAQIVVTIARHEFIATDLVPLLGGFDSRGANRVDAQADRRTPGHGVFDKLHFLAVVSEEKRTRAFQALLGKDGLIPFCFKLGAYRSIGPYDAHHIGAGLIAQTKVDNRARDQLLLHEQTGADFHLAPDTEAVDALIARRLGGARTNCLPVIVLRAVADCVLWSTVR